MALTEELPIYKATYDLVLIIFRFTKNFKREYKYTIGESLKNETIAAITNIYRANTKRDKRIDLEKARENIEVIRLYIRLLKDLHQINTKQLVYVNSYIENISKQLTGWYKTQIKKQ
ncbi:MAG: four helix bundle protein [Ignavibacteriae bacterium]|nr:four helix bundle protein [Ignavibacteriota bacterium]